MRIFKTFKKNGQKNQTFDFSECHKTLVEENMGISSNAGSITQPIFAIDTEIPQAVLSNAPKISDKGGYCSRNKKAQRVDQKSIPLDAWENNFHKFKK